MQPDYRAGSFHELSIRFRKNSSTATCDHHVWLLKKFGQNFRLSFAKAGFAFMSKNILNRSASALFNHIIAVDP